MGNKTKNQKLVRVVAWKNVWRSPVRSLIVISAVMLGTIAGIFTSALMQGWTEQRKFAAIYTEVSHAQIHNPNYLINEELKHTINNSSEILHMLQNSSEVKAYSPKIKVMAMASTSRGNTALILNGIDIEKEKQVSNLYRFVVNENGKYLEEDQRLPIFVSEKTAEQLKIVNFKITDSVIDSLKKANVPSQVIDNLSLLKNTYFRSKSSFEKELKAKLSENNFNKYKSQIIAITKQYRPRAKIVFTFNNINGNLISQYFKVCGIYKTSNSSYDQQNAFVKNEDLRTVLDLGANEYNEISILLNDMDHLSLFEKEFSQKFTNTTITKWQDLAPDVGMLDGFMTLYLYIIMGIIMFALAFGIVNTMLMAILERTKELGMLMAIGMTKRKVFKMIMYETIFLTIVGAIIGMIISYIIVQITSRTGINFSAIAEGMEAMGWAAKVYPNISISFFAGITIMVIITGIIASISPTRKAIKMNPVDALKTD